jgi:hypothetical protein
MPDETSHSPTKNKDVSPELPKISSSTINIQSFDFSRALDLIVDGRKVHKLEWQDQEYYGVLHDATLMLHKPDGKLYAWIISEGDLIGTDFIVI